MERNKTDNITRALQWMVILATNLFFVCKYFPRAGFNPVISAILYALLATTVWFVYKRFVAPHLSKRISAILAVSLVTIISLAIAIAVIYIPPLSIRVDRWSATSYFLDGLFKGIYPYGIHTHVSETNYPSPFPLWHYLNIPFWLLGDVGWQNMFFFWLFICAIYYYSRSWQVVLSVLMILVLSPAYWWEVATRSDGLSNALLVVSCILGAERFPLRMENKWWLLAIIAGCMASTRLSAIIPIALFLFRPWWDANWKIKIGFIAIVAAVIGIAFAPYIFWDTTNWIFFQRNPFMSQTGPGNIWILLVMVIIAVFIAYRKETFYYFLCTTSVFMFAFMLITQLNVIWQSETPATLFDICCDISYFTLSVPYAILALSSDKCSNIAG